MRMSESAYWRRLTQNPLVQRELARSWRKHGRLRRVLLMVWAALMGAVLGCGAIVLLSGSPVDLSGGDVKLQPQGTHLAALGAGLPTFCLLGVLSSILSGLLPWIVPIFTAVSIVRERERGTFDVLRVTLLTEPAIAWGKLATPFLRLWPAILTLLFLSPLQLAWMSISGIMWGQPMIMLGMTGAAIDPGAAPLGWPLWGGALLFFVIEFLRPWTNLIFYATIGLFISTWARSTALAVALTYGAMLVIRFGFSVLTMLSSTVVPLLLFDMTSSASGADPTGLFWTSALGAALILLTSWIGAVALFGGAAWRLRQM